MTHVPEELREIHLFCDGCAGQNKNWTVLRYFHYLVHELKRFDTLKVSFPICWHSYMECDSDMTNVKQGTRVETPSGWHDVFKSARVHPSPYNVIAVSQDKFKNYSTHLRSFYRLTCPAPTRPLREVKFEIDHPRLMLHRDCWNGPFCSSVVCKGARSRKQPAVPLEASYDGPLPISDAKHADLQVLKRFCSPENQPYYEKLVHNSTAAEENDE